MIIVSCSFFEWRRCFLSPIFFLTEPPKISAPQLFLHTYVFETNSKPFIKYSWSLCGFNFFNFESPLIPPQKMHVLLVGLKNHEISSHWCDWRSKRTLRHTDSKPSFLEGPSWFLGCGNSLWPFFIFFPRNLQQDLLNGPLNLSIYCNSSSNLLRGPLVRFHLIFDGFLRWWHVTLLNC